MPRVGEAAARHFTGVHCATLDATLEITACTPWDLATHLLFRGAMNVSIRTLKSHAAILLAVEPSESLSDFKKRCSSQLPYNGNCRFLLRVRM